jgi:hypothetical protein
MRRVRDRRPSTPFRGSELTRLATLGVMLGVLALLISRARDPDTWRWLAPDASGQSSGESKAEPPESDHDDVVASDPAARGPSDRDPEERDAAREEFQGVTDKTPLAKEEMPAYWRLMAWQQHESLKELRGRAKKDITFKQLWQQPEKWRGQLVEIPMHLRQTATVEDLADNALGLKSMHEVWGWNSDSQPYWFWLVCPRLPPGMPAGGNIYEEATFVGYFLKLIPYEDHQGISRATPLLIGRLIWHPIADNPLARSDEWTWPWLVAGVLAVLFAARWGVRLAGQRTKVRASPASPALADDQTVAAWLERAKDEPLDDHDEPDNSRANGPV